jgi:SAM-dependent methyltransferase
MSDRSAHWEEVWESRSPDEVSWFEPEPTMSLAMLASLDLDRSAPVVDVGAGSSFLVDRLVERGFGDVTLLDASAHALAVVRARLGDAAGAVTFVCSDVLRWRPDRRYGLWHDRAVFHFLVDDADRAAYVDLVAGAVHRGGYLVVGTFAADGPTHCSGLPVARYTTAELAAVFSASFALVQEARDDHTTPAGGIQPFSWVALRRR